MENNILMREFNNSFYLGKNNITHWANWLVKLGSVKRRPNSDAVSLAHTPFAAPTRQ